MNKEHLLALSITIDVLTDPDIQQLIPILEVHVRNKTTDELIASEVQAIQTYMRGGVDEFGRTRNYLVAKDQSGKVWGCMAYSKPDPDMANHFVLGEEASSYIELLNAFVAIEAFRGGGIGRKLFDAIADAGKREGKHALLVHSGPRYIDSWGFYDIVTDYSCGFIENKYGLGRNAKTWIKQLRSQNIDLNAVNDEAS